MALPETERLLDAAQRGDRAALEALLTQHRETVFRYGLRYCGSTENTEDAVQETLWAAAKAIGGFRRAAAVTTWLFTIVRNKCHRLMFHKHDQADLADLLPRVPDPGRSPEDDLATRQIQHILAEALARLEPSHREVVLLRDVEGLTAPEAADQLGLTVQALKSRLHRAREQLRAEVSGLKGLAS
ncbi:MAG TPA: sigma-70 family RNA polymerase sigma factor [Casimicrobiaceae bacterium]|nr:sigma-70 family RNA polymerase sigma factor [Casimicrobiaceae bacterium]